MKLTDTALQVEWLYPPYRKAGAGYPSEGTCCSCPSGKPGNRRVRIGLLTGNVNVQLPLILGVWWSKIWGAPQRISITRRVDCVESPFASRHSPKRVTPLPARATGAVGLDAMLAC